MPSTGSTAPILATTPSNAGRVIANSTGPNNRCRQASVTDSATQFFPTSTATTTVDGDTGAATTDTTHLRGARGRNPRRPGTLHANERTWPVLHPPAEHPCEGPIQVISAGGRRIH